MKEPTPLLRMRRISKRFGATQVLRQVDLDVFAGEVHLLAGENGAGKSTLMKILAGTLTADAGVVEGSADVAVIYQELSLIPTMTVADNLFLGRMPATWGFVSMSEMARRSRELIDVDPYAHVGTLPIGARQRVEIAKAVSRNARVIVMDEPTSALTALEAAELFALIGALKSRGCGIVYITHKMEETEQIADRVTVLRDGQVVASCAAAELKRAELIRLMVGREVSEQFPLRQPVLGEERVRFPEFSVRAGEIVGLAGLRGAGASELLMSLFAAPRKAIAQGVAMLTSDRKTTGLVLSMSVTANCLMAGRRPVWRRPERERAEARGLADLLRLRAASLEMEARELSGGNQQKVALAKWIRTRPSLLLLDEPTRGIDVGAKQEIYQLMNEWSRQGMAILLISSELPELLALSDKVVVMRGGKVSAVLSKEESTPERVMEAAC
ncbi:MAG: sugar ABC transporter ATP-binding protein [Bryobacterales bacterium]|nr:sugar ABC transporter ATP-binding protein [Bryobacterales bacterium]